VVVNDDRGWFDMAPSEFQHALSMVDERLRTAHTVAASLISYACAALAAVFAVHGITPVVGTSSVLAVLGGVGAVAAARVLQWKRMEIYDEIVLYGYRHVGRNEIARHTADLISPERRRMLADTLERFLEFAVQRRVAAVPLNRRALRELEPNIRGLCARLRAVDVAVDPAGMVLLRRLLTDGATSPIFKANGPLRDLERAIEHIHSQLGPMPVIQLRPAAVSEPLRLAA
jgi:hypothetical protein